MVHLHRIPFLAPCSMRHVRLIVVYALTAPLLLFAGTSSTSSRNRASTRINSCLEKNRECKHLDRDVETLVHAYGAGDKSVLPILFHFTYLTSFYDEALLSDPMGFLDAMKQLNEKDQQSVAVGIAGGEFNRLPKDKFDAIREILVKIPSSEQTWPTAQRCLKALETNNASLFLNYFPPNTFTSTAGRFQIFWYSRDMYSLGQMPLWPPASNEATIYRFTYLGAFTGPEVIILTITPQSEAQLHIRTLNFDRNIVESDQSILVPKEGVSEFLDALNQAHFWDMPVEPPNRGFDGAEWIMEGVQRGQYHIAVRWCPDLAKSFTEEKSFAAAGRLLFELAAQKHSGGC